jgi:TonB family protein
MIRALPGVNPNRSRYGADIYRSIEKMQREATMRDKFKKWALLTALLAGCTLSCYPAQQIHTIDDKDVKVIQYSDLGYPAIAVLARIEGVVVVRVTLDGNGKVLGADAVSGATTLAASSVANVQKWRFEPNPEKAAVIVYNFRIRGNCHAEGVHSQMVFYPPNFAEITACPGPVNAP